MKEDKKLQSLLNKYALQEPSEGFDEKVMHLITGSKAKHATLMNGLFNRLLLIIFIAVTTALLITAFFIQPKVLTTPVSISISISNDMYRQLFSFLGAFWIVMLVNLWWNKKNTIAI